MKSIKILIAGVLLLAVSCAKDREYHVNLPDSLGVNEAVVYMNGELSEFNRLFVSFHDSYESDYFGITIGKTSAEDVWIDSTLIVEHFTALYFSWIIPETSNYEFQRFDAPTFGVVRPGMGQIVGYDLRGASFKHIPITDEYFEITEYDPEEKLIAGRFKVKYKRTKKNGISDDEFGVEKWMTFEGAFRGVAD